VAPATFGTAINCIDGRTQLPLINWLREVQQLEYIDLITEPGPDGLLARDPQRAADLVLPKVRLSLARHASPLLVIAAHHDCLANPISDEEHRALLIPALGVLRGWQLGVKVMALWVNASWSVDIVQTRGGTA
jgi:Putative carbonic anhydrase